ncbi:MAG: hypothetical protein LBP69_08035 [Treponema sp.]|jgi:hypothetical protein|nr:hypothetical protein [Treponema sp.]
MKKIMLGVLILAAAGGLFAQELKFDGYLNSGLGIVSTDTRVPDGSGTKTADTKIVPFGVDSEQGGYRFRLNGSYTNAEGTAGAKFRFQAQSSLEFGAFSLPYAYGWVSFLNKIFTVTGGLVDDGTWNLGSPLLNDDVGEGLGALVKISPITGLNLGVGAYVLNQQSGSRNNFPVIPAGYGTRETSSFSSLDIPLDRLKYTFSAGYTMPDLFKVIATFRTANQAGDKTSRYTNADLESFAGRDETSKLIFGLQLLAVKNLTAIVEVSADKLEDSGVDKDKDNIDFDFYETLGYKTGDLSFGLNAVQYIRTEKDVDHDLGLHFNPWVSYAIGSIVPRLDLNYFLAGKALTGTAAWVDADNDPTTPSVLSPPLPGASYHRKVFSYADNGKADDVSVIAVRPSVKFNIDKNTFIEIGDLIAFSTGPEGAFADADDPKKSSNLNNVFYVDFVWKF